MKEKQPIGVSKQSIHFGAYIWFLNLFFLSTVAALILM